MRNHYYFNNKHTGWIGLLFRQQTTTVLYRTIISDINAARMQKRESSLVFFLSEFSFADNGNSKGSRSREGNFIPLLHLHTLTNIEKIIHSFTFEMSGFYFNHSPGNYQALAQ